MTLTSTPLHLLTASKPVPQLSSMQMYPSLPNELLHSIVEYIAYTPKLPNSRSKSSFKSASPELLALSVANWQLRRVCLPLLFADIALRRIKDTSQLECYLTHFSRFTRVLVMDNNRTSTEDHIISQILPQLKQLQIVELPDCQNRTDLLRTILALPTVTSVLVNDLPGESMCDHGLSKVVLDRISSTTALSSEFEKYVDRGMNITCLELSENNLLNNQFQFKIFPGLKEIRIVNHRTRDSLSWLSVLSPTHPALNEVWLRGRICGGLKDFDYLAPPFLSPLIKESRRRGLHETFTIKSIGLHRAVGQSSQGWYVIGLTLEATSPSTSLIVILALVASSFPKLEKLTFNLGPWREPERMYDIDDLVSVFARFSSLRILYLNKVFGWLKFKPEIEKLMPPVRSVKPTAMADMKARAESGLLLFVSRLAKQVRTLDSIRIYETYQKWDDILDKPTKSWAIQGWLHVLNGDRDVSRTLVSNIYEL
ncbi:hypothetical protein F5878DRAFT_728787 [Lentinula raphanica]|uniref:Uncharacterized protein n=1 Tax=Lentinula raphanica TaxID=153919 RepID=A0AA38U710_9AGAR|nr:hypothetical protein F5878DRAFT_728787 [Lentinula raphanica]